MAIKNKKQVKKRKLTRIEKNKKIYNINAIARTKNNKQFILLLLAISLIFNAIFLFQSFKTNVLAKEKDQEEQKEEIKVPDNYLFLGDSITQFYDLEKYFPNMPVINSGISGNTTTDILKDMRNRVYKYNASKIFVLIGTNDLRDERSPEEVITNIKKIIRKIKKNQPQAVIYLESIYPVNADIDEDMVEGRKNSDIVKINKELKEYAKDNNITYINTYNKLLNEDGKLKEEYSNDGLHLTDEGYIVVTKELKKYLN